MGVVDVRRFALGGRKLLEIVIFSNIFVKKIQ